MTPSEVARQHERETRRQAAVQAAEEAAARVKEAQQEAEVARRHLVELSMDPEEPTDLYSL